MIKYKENKRFQVLTPTGFQPFSGIRKTSKHVVVRLHLSDGTVTQVSSNHKIVYQGVEFLAKNLLEGQQIGNSTVVLKK